MSQVRLTIDNISVHAKEETSVLDAAGGAGIYIPSLCADPDLEPYGACRLCLVEIEGMEGMVASCTTPVGEGMVVRTDTERLNQTRRDVLALLLSDHPADCILCPKSQRCELQKVAAYLGVEPRGYARLERQAEPDTSHPMFVLDSSKCILCGKCVRACKEIQGRSAIQVSHNGRLSRIVPSTGTGLVDSSCESCGQCMAKCPTAAIMPKGFEWPSGEISSVCPYCGVGCGIKVAVRSGRVVGVSGDVSNPVNRGSLCVKGRFGLEFVNHPDRLTQPLIRRNGHLSEASWEETLDLIAGNLGRFNGEQTAVISSAKCTNEENYLIQKLARAVLGTNNVDHCARLCHASTVAGLGQSFGSGAMTNSIDEISGAACILAIGTNTTATHPVIGLRVRKAVGNGTRLIVANPREIDLCRIAHIWLRHRPGSDVALLMGMMRVIVEEGLQDESFIRERCENFEPFMKSLDSFDPEKVEQLTGVDRELIGDAARLFAEQKPGSILYAMGITQHTHGTDNVLALADLAMLTGNVGKPSSGVNPLRGQNNVQGACDMGALPDVFPGYQRVTDPQALRKFQKAWGRSLPASPGATLMEIFGGARKGEIRSVYLVGENPLLSDPDLRHVRDALANLDFLVVQDIFRTETAEMAHVVLPGSTFAEKDGTFTNTERRVQRIRKALEPRGNSRPDWRITCDIAKRMGANGFDFGHPSQIMEEIARLTPIYGGISYARLESEGLQWPCRDAGDPGTPILHVGRFTRGRGRFVPLEYRPSAETPDREYPLLLTTERVLAHYHTGSMTRRVDGINRLHGEERVQVHPADAEELGIRDGEMVRIVSRRGEVRALAKLTSASPKGVVAMSFHFAESPVNQVTNPAMDPVAKIPELKVCAVRVEKAG
jgi:formate dehydrogenase alpha subunit